MYDLTLYKGNSLLLRLEGLENHLGETVADATVTATISRGATQLWSGDLDPVEGSPGDYEAGLAPADSAGMTAGEVLKGVITAVGSGLTFVDRVTVKVKTR